MDAGRRHVPERFSADDKVPYVAVRVTPMSAAQQLARSPDYIDLEADRSKINVIWFFRMDRSVPSQSNFRANLLPTGVCHTRRSAKSTFDSSLLVA